MSNKDLEKKNEIELTDQNWLLLKHIQAGRSIKDAYALAGYKGTNPQQPYQMYHRLKKKLEQVYDADNVDSLRLKIEAKKILDMEIEDKPVKPETKLKAIETLSKLTGQDKESQRSISPFVVFKADDVQISQVKGKVIDAQVVETEEEKEAD